MGVGEFKTRIVEAFDAVMDGEEVVIADSEMQVNIAVLLPYSDYKHNNSVKLGSLAGVASVRFADDYEMTSEELAGECASTAQRA